jgi:protein phosphatase
MNPENLSATGVASPSLLRLLRPSVVVLCGPAACGKSTFAQRHFRPTQIISSDWARAHVCDDDRDQRFNAQAFALVHFLVEQRLTLNRLCVVDSTALTPSARRELLDLAKKYKAPAVLLLFDVPLEACVERDEKRQRSVGRAVIERHYQAFEQARLTIRQEGFDQVVEIHDRDLQKVEVEILFRPIVRPTQRFDATAGNRSERRVQSFRARPSDLNDGRSVSPGPGVPPAQRTTASRPASAHTTAPSPAGAVRQPGDATASVASPNVTPTVSPPSPPATANK